MSAIAQWSHKWFGVWSEFGPEYAKCPSITEFVDHRINAAYPKSEIVRYLRESPVVAVTSRYGFPNLFTGERLGGTIAFRTDGKWVWLDDIAGYVEQYDVCVPDKMLADMKAAAFCFPISVPDDIADHLEWPPS